MKKDSNVVNIFGSFFLIYMCLEYLLVLGDISIELHLVLLTMTAIYYLIFRTLKKRYIEIDDVIGWLIMSIISAGVFYGINHFGYMVSCGTLFCIKGYRDIAFVLSNFAFFGVMLIINILSFITRLLFLKENKTRKF